MRTVSCAKISRVVADLCQEANTKLPHDIELALVEALAKEESSQGRAVLADLVQNATLARQKSRAICQDTGMAVVFVTLGQEVRITGGSLADAVHEGVRLGYSEGYLRNSVVLDPLLRENSGDNTPAVIHYELVPGDHVWLEVAPKGFGSENMSGCCLLSPAEGEAGMKKFVLDLVQKAGPNPCPPIIVGLGLGGTLEKAALLAKKALLLPVGSRNEIEHLALLEDELLTGINDLGIGPGGLGGCTTALDVHILAYPTHIAGLPLVVNISCHATRHAKGVI